MGIQSEADFTRTGFTASDGGGRAKEDDQGLLLVLVTGPEVGRSLRLERGSVRIGGGPNADLRLSDATVSRLHAEVAIARDGVRVRDLESKNGTWVGDERILEAVLPRGSILRVGQTEIALGGVPAPSARGDRPARYGVLVAHSPAMRRLFEMLERIEASDSTVLILGETGTGKEVVAREVHAHSRRRKGSFVVFDCAAVARELLESELFGHVRGSFTGAVADRAGVVERADGGTLFLDEIGDLSLELQPNLLRLLEAREWKRMGSDEVRTADIRVIAAAHGDLGRQIAEERFRRDLYYRLAVVRLYLPPLRERPEDIPALADHLWELAGGNEASRPIVKAQLAAMGSYEWLGNVRELRNLVEHVATLGVAPPRDLAATEPKAAARGGSGLPVDLGRPYKEARSALLDAFERQYLSALLARSGGNISRAARLGGIDRNVVKRLMEKHGIGRR